ncbi:eukaryotic translation initiation factor 3 subunit 7-domain-containing protein [Lentinula raphanica]|uniref:Eukaryotic translation initiation factor 3 subunit 7-domain-containing protein n=1 Tax=Lentinula raphanica TaxID=153919 RepID=A0AA38P0S0_9AGAR|nr:eukaryotic translation initiation factor 3 subunit 7-domain-containing protein [Lentinula raphanica]
MIAVAVVLVVEIHLLPGIFLRLSRSDCRTLERRKVGRPSSWSFELPSSSVSVISGVLLGGRGGNAQRGRCGWRDWDKNARTRESSAVLSPQRSMLEEIGFHRLAKLRLEVDEPENICLYAYDKSFDRITTKMEEPLQQLDHAKYNTTTSDDPVIQQLVSKNTATIYAPMSSSVSSCVPQDSSPINSVTVYENALDPPQDPPPPNPDNANEKIPHAPSINSATSLSLEAPYDNQNFAFQTVVETPPPPGIDPANPNPFYGPDEMEPLVSCGYRDWAFDLSVQEDENFIICVRTEVEAYLPGSGNPREGHGSVTIRALKDSCKLAQWTVPSILAGA